MSILQLDQYGHEELSPRGSEPPEDSELVAVAGVYCELIGGKESYWLSPAGDGHATYELWASFSELPGHVFCYGRLSECNATTANEAAQELLRALWSARHPSAMSLSGFERAGLLGMGHLGRIHREYEQRLKPKRAPRLGRTVQGELQYEDGSLKYRGEMRGGLPHGRGTGYWGNGQPWCEGEFRDGNPHGACKMYFSDGTLRHEGEFVEGLPQGRGTEYRDDGKIWFRGIFGKQTMYYGYGARIWIEGQLYDERGTLLHDGKFVRDGRHSRPADAGAAD